EIGGLVDTAVEPETRPHSGHVPMLLRRPAPVQGWRSALAGGVLRAGLFAGAVLGLLLREDLLLLDDRDDVAVGVGRDSAVRAGDLQALGLLVGALAVRVEGAAPVADAVRVGE